MSVDDVVESGTDTVDVTLTYTTGGAQQSETRRIYLVESDGTYRIDDDEVVG